MVIAVQGALKKYAIEEEIMKMNNAECQKLKVINPKRANYTGLQCFQGCIYNS